MAGGTVDAGDTVRGVLPADAEVCGLGGAISWRARQGMSTPANLSKALDLKSIHPGLPGPEISPLFPLLGALSRWLLGPLWAIKQGQSSTFKTELKGASGRMSLMPPL